MNDTIIKNSKQLFFNQVRGVIEELNDGEEFCNVTLKVGHENNRNVNLVLRKKHFEELVNDVVIGDKVSARFYVASRKKHDRWYTTANLLEMQKEN
jgi:hypothetical protein